MLKVVSVVCSRYCQWYAQGTVSGVLKVCQWCAQGTLSGMLKVVSVVRCHKDGSETSMSVKCREYICIYVCVCGGGGEECAGIQRGPLK